MAEINRRDFIKAVAIGGAVLGLEGAIFHDNVQAAGTNGKIDIGQCKSVRVKCVSEVGWYDDKKIVRDMKQAGGFHTDQWIIPWDSENAAGACSLVDMEAIDGTRHRFLLDCGWDNQYMDACFKREGIDWMLKNGEIEFLMISHEHLDHYWGAGNRFKIQPSDSYLHSEHLQSGRHLFSHGRRIQNPPSSQPDSPSGKADQAEARRDQQALRRVCGNQF
jgi:7,8-dihydropterin-6-yl-methyl-4-(beta-D-ribofuranosyl)aminobenzene 5'-phosphate synthase